MSLFNCSAGMTAFAIATIALSGCFVEAGVSAGTSTSPPPTGTISLLSSIEGSTDPVECAYVCATELEFAVYDRFGLYTTVTAACESFDLSVSLPEGTYSGDATLLDEHSRATSTTLKLDDLRVVAGTDLQVAIDFPTSSILP